MDKMLEDQIIRFLVYVFESSWFTTFVKDSRHTQSIFIVEIGRKCHLRYKEAAKERFR